MTVPIEICLEELDLPPDDDRYIRCVALPGSQPGLALDREGVVRWMPEEPAAYGLWVSADDNLVLRRGEHAGPIIVDRGGRSLEAPVAKPVVLRHGDLLQVNGRRLKIHVHGATAVARAPERLSLARLARSTAAALALGAMVGAGGEATAGQPGSAAVGAAPPIEVRQRPPDMAPVRRVVCTVTSIKARKKGTLVVRASCPEKLQANVWGQLLDSKSRPIKNGSVQVKKVKGKNIEAHATSLKRPVKARNVLFRVN